MIVRDIPTTMVYPLLPSFSTEKRGCSVTDTALFYSIETVVSRNARAFLTIQRR